MELRPEQRKEAIFGNYAERAPADPARPGIWCYTDALSYAPGDRVTVYVNATAGAFRVVLVRDGATTPTLYRGRFPAGRFHATPADCSVTGCAWPAGFEIATGEDWPSGGYRLTLIAEDGASWDHLFILRPAPGPKPGRLLLIAATSSWTAYNDWGGTNHYEGLTGPNGDRCSGVLSTLRPWARGLVRLPRSAPRAVLAKPPTLAAPIRYPHMEWAYATGHSKKYVSAGWASFERHFLRWAEAQGYAVDVIGQTDLHYRPALLDDYRLAVMVGHDEYWSWAMRDAIDGFVERGGRVARFAANFMWQIRLEQDGRRQICYKYRARDEDPVRGTEDERYLTESWESQAIGRPGALSFGLNALRGLYAGWGGCVPRGSSGFTVYRPDHWAFAGTGLGYGDLLGDASRIFGYEVDGLDYRFEQGLPYPAPGQAVPPGLDILAMGVSSLVERGGETDALFLGQDDAAYTARTLYGSDDPAAIDRVARGAGMIVHFERGAGEVFHAGTSDWVMGLTRADPFVERVTRTVLDRYRHGTRIRR